MDYLYSRSESGVVVVDQWHLLCSKDAYFLEDSREGILGKDICMQEDSSSYLQVFLYLVQDVVLVKYNCPGLNPSWD